MKGTGPKRIKNITLSTNPCRISFMGKEIIICRYNYFRKLQSNHLSKLQDQQDKQQEGASVKTPDTFRIAKTILNQGVLLPLPPIV